MLFLVIVMKTIYWSKSETDHICKAKGSEVVIRKTKSNSISLDKDLNGKRNQLYTFDKAKLQGYEAMHR